MSVSWSDSSDLLCSEDYDINFSGRGEDSPEWSLDFDYLQPHMMESIAGLIEEERDLVANPRSASQSADYFVRAESVAWMLKVRSHYGFQPLTAYLSVNYFDRFLQSCHLRKLHGWQLQLLSVACLSLSAKMEEPLVPSLLGLQVEGAKFIFEPRNIQRMELLVLKVLDWRLRSISPFCYLSFFSFKIDPTGIYTRFLISKAKHIILSTIKENSFLEFRPSCIAAATILCAAHDLPKFSSINPQQVESWCHGLDKEKFCWQVRIASCYQIMRQVTFNMPKRQPKVLPQLRVMARASLDSSDLTSFSSSSSCKRRKLSSISWVDDDKRGL